MHRQAALALTAPLAATLAPPSRFSRFDKKEAGPRNVAALSGKKAKQTAKARGGGAKALPDDL